VQTSNISVTHEDDAWDLFATYISSTEVYRQPLSMPILAISSFATTSGAFISDRRQVFDAKDLEFDLLGIAPALRPGARPRKRFLRRWAARPAWII
jgi:hypothetical protein